MKRFLTSAACAALWLAAARAAAAGPDGGRGDAGAADGGRGDGGPSAAGSGEDRYYAAQDLERAGDHAGAVTALLAVADELPDDPFAPFALNAAATIDEQVLGQPEAALALYRRVLSRYPDKRAAVLAAARVAVLAPNLTAGGAQPWREFSAVLNGFATRPRAESIRQVEAILARTPDFPAAAQATLFLAGAYRDDGRTGEARAAYHKVIERWPQAPEAPQAWQALGGLDLGAGHFADARADYRALRGFGSANLDQAADDGVAAVDREQRLARWYVWGLLFLAGFVLLHTALIVVPRGRSARPQWLPVELGFYLPLGALFVLVALTENRAIATATGTIVGGGAVIVWLTANALRCRPPARRTWLARATAHALAALLAVSSLGFVAIHRAYLTELVSETISHGVER